MRLILFNLSIVAMLAYLVWDSVPQQTKEAMNVPLSTVETQIEALEERIELEPVLEAVEEPSEPLTEQEPIFIEAIETAQVPPEEQLEEALVTTEPFQSKVELAEGEQLMSATDRINALHEMAEALEAAFLTSGN